MNSQPNAQDGPVNICVFGTFDLIHIGHILFLENVKPAVRARFYPDKKLSDLALTVIVARDSSVKQIKNKKPVFPENHRLKIISAIKFVDRSLLGNESGSKFNILGELPIDVIVLGYDQWVSEKQLLEEKERRKLSFKILRLPHFGSKLDSSTSVKEAINSKNHHDAGQ
ncbi:MAG: adenylyltransferase/cytidyltransferase family protein [Candidatus Hodarchaeales archaeon]